MTVPTSTVYHDRCFVVVVAVAVVAVVVVVAVAVVVAAVVVAVVLLVVLMVLLLLKQTRTYHTAMSHLLHMKTAHRTHQKRLVWSSCPIKKCC